MRSTNHTCSLKTLFKLIELSAEIYIPVLSFVIMFGMFIVQIFARYILKSPISWAYEVTVTSYLWLVILGGILAQKENVHVRFSLIYDKCSLWTQHLLSLLGNTVLAVAFIYSIIPSWKFIRFMGIQETSVLHLSLTFVYMPYIIFLVLISIYLVHDIVKDIHGLFAKGATVYGN